MAKLSIKPGSADVSLTVFILDSTSTAGAGKTGLAYNTGSLVCYYVRPGSAAAALSLVTQTVTGAHADGGFVEIDSTNMPGAYRLDLSDAVIAAGVRSVMVMLKGATGMAPLVLEIDLNAEVNTTQVAGTAQTARDLGASVLLSNGTGTGQISLTSGAVTAGSLGTQAKSDVNAEVVDVLRTDTLPDSYSAHEAQPTIAQAILAIHQFLFEREVSGTSVTIQKPNGSTTVMTLTLNDGTNPTTVHRSA